MSLRSVSDLKRLATKLAKVAQATYDSWDEDVDEYAGGGICHLIADEMSSVLDRAGIECSTVSAQIGEQHVWVVAKVKEGVFEIDLNPYTYETGGGYSWKKIPDVKINASDISIAMLDPDPNKFGDYIEEDLGGGVPVNNAGGGQIAGLGVGPKGEPGVDNRPKKKKKLDEESLADLLKRAFGIQLETDGSMTAGVLRDGEMVYEETERETFAGAPVFEVDMDRIMKTKNPKHPRHRYARYVGTDEVGETIRQHGRSTRGDIVIKDSKTAVMTYLRRRPRG